MIITEGFEALAHGTVGPSQRSLTMRHCIYCNYDVCVTFGVYIWFPAISVVSVRHSGPLWCVRHQRCHDSLMNIEQQALEATSGPRVLLGRSW